MRMSRWLVGFGIAGLALTLTACNSSTPSGGGSGTSTVNVTTVGTVPWVAAQDGTSAWATLSGSSFTVSNAAGKYGVAWVCLLGSGQYQVHITQATTADATGVTASCQASASGGTGSATGTLSGIPSGGTAYISVGGQAISYSGSTSTTYTLSGIATGTQTIIAWGMDSSNALTSVYVQRGVTITNGGTTTVNVGLNSSTHAVTTGLAAYSVNLTGAPSSETSGVAVDYLTGAASGNIIASSTTSSLGYPVIPAALAQTSDKYEFLGDAHTSGYYTGSGGDDQQALFVSQTPTSITGLSVPSVLPGAAGIGVSGGTATATWGSPTFSTSTGLTAFLASVTPTSTTTKPIWYAYVSSNWLGSATSYTFPDFSGTSGWNANWNFPTGATANAWVNAVHANLTLQQLLTAVQSNTYPNGTSIEMTQRLAVGGTY